MGVVEAVLAETCNEDIGGCVGDHAWPTHCNGKAI
jgi:hypothetical protein